MVIETFKRIMFFLGIFFGGGRLTFFQRLKVFSWD